MPLLTHLTHISHLTLLTPHSSLITHHTPHTHVTHRTRSTRPCAGGWWRRVTRCGRGARAGCWRCRASWWPATRAPARAACWVRAAHVSHMSQIDTQTNHHPARGLCVCTFSCWPVLFDSNPNLPLCICTALQTSNICDTRHIPTQDTRHIPWLHPSPSIPHVTHPDTCKKAHTPARTMHRNPNDVCRCVWKCHRTFPNMPICGCRGTGGCAPAPE